MSRGDFRKFLFRLANDPLPRRWWTPLVELTMRVTVGTVMLTVIALAACGLELLTDWMEEHHFAGWLVVGIKICEITVGLGDIIFFLVFVAYEITTALYNLPNDDHHKNT